MSVQLANVNTSQEQPKAVPVVFVASDLQSTKSEEICAICQETLENMILGHDQHQFHSDCAAGALSVRQVCPICVAPVENAAKLAKAEIVDKHTAKAPIEGAVIRQPGNGIWEVDSDDEDSVPQTFIVDFGYIADNSNDEDQIREVVRRDSILTRAARVAMKPVCEVGRFLWESRYHLICALSIPSILGTGMYINQ